jgi:hypothetical protein
VETRKFTAERAEAAERINFFFVIPAGSAVILFSWNLNETVLLQSSGGLILW